MADTTLRVIIIGDSASAKRALEDLSGASSATAGKLEGDMDKATSHVGGLFESLGNKLGNWGLPFSNSLTTMGEKFDEAKSKGTGLQQSLSTLGGATLLGLGAGLAGVAAESVHLGLSFDSAVSKIAANAGISETAAKRIGDAFLTTAGSTTFSATEMAEAYAPVATQLASVEGHSLSAGQALSVMRAATDLAEASGESLSSTTSGLASTMQAFGLNGGQKPAAAADVLYNAAKISDTPISTLTTSVDKLHAKLGDTTPSLKDVATLMAFPQVASLGSRGVMTVSSSLTTLLGGSKAVTTELQQLGVNVFDSHGKFVGLQGVIQQLGPALSGMSDQQRDAAEKTLFGAGAAQVMGQVMEAGTAGYDKAAEAVSRVGTAQAAAEKTNDNLKGSAEKLKVTLEDTGTKIGEALIPKLEDLATDANDVLQFFEHNKAAAEALGIVIGGVLSVAVATFTYGKLADMAKGIKGIFTDVSSLASKLTGLNLPGSSGSGSSASSAAGAEESGSTLQTALTEGGETAAASLQTALETGGTTAAESIRAALTTGASEGAATLATGEETGATTGAATLGAGEETGAVTGAATLAGGEELGAVTGAATLAGGEELGAVTGAATLAGGEELGAVTGAATLAGGEELGAVTGAATLGAGEATGAVTGAATLGAGEVTGAVTGAGALAGGEELGAEIGASALAGGMTSGANLAGPIVGAAILAAGTAIAIHFAQQSEVAGLPPTNTAAARSGNQAAQVNAAENAISGAAFNTPLPQHAEGGIATSPTAGVFGESGPEALIPLPANWESSIFGSGGITGAGGGPEEITISQPLVLNLDGQTLLRTTQRVSSRRGRATTRATRGLTGSVMQT